MPCTPFTRFSQGQRAARRAITVRSLAPACPPEHCGHVRTRLQVSPCPRRARRGRLHGCARHRAHARVGGLARRRHQPGVRRRRQRRRHFTNDFIELLQPRHRRGRPSPAGPCSTPRRPARLAGHAADRHHRAGRATTWCQEAAGAGGTTPLPTPDATGTIAMSGDRRQGRAGHQRDGADLRRPLRRGGRASATSSATAGPRTTSRAPRPPGLSNTTAALARCRRTDTDNNAADFTAGAPDPATRAADRRRRPTRGAPAIHDIQGAAHTLAARRRSWSRRAGRRHRRSPATASRSRTRPPTPTPPPARALRLHRRRARQSPSATR